MKDNGFSIELSTADVQSLQSDYPNNIIPADEWDALIEAGYSDANLRDNGFIKKTNLKGH